MNKNLYMETMNKISMNENCTERIIKEAESSVNTSQYKPKRKIRFIPVMAAAAAALTCGTWAAAESGGFEWIRTFFSETSTDMEITDVETSLIGEMENFSYESSSSDISFTPVGMIADKLNIYCIVKPEGIDAEQIQFIALNSDGIDYESGYSGNLDAYEDENTGNLIIKYNLCEQYFSENNNVDIYLSNYNSNNISEDEKARQTFIDINSGKKYIDLQSHEWENDFDIFRISFTLNFGNINTLHVGYNNYPKEVNYQITDLIITPLSAIIESSGETVINDNELKLIMTDESIIYVNPLFNGGYFTYEDGKSPYHHAQWIFDEPIDPDNISQVYINDNLIYEKE